MEATSVNSPELFDIVNVVPSGFYLEKQSWQNSEPNILPEYAMGFEKLTVFFEDRHDNSSPS